MTRSLRLLLTLSFVSSSLAGLSQSVPFVTTWSTTDSEVTIPTFDGETYSYNIDWENLTNSGVNEGSASSQTGSYTISGLENGSTYRISIFGTFPRIYFNNSGDKDKILTIEQWGTVGGGFWTSMEDAFNGCTALNITASSPPNLGATTNMDRMFQGATSLNSDLSGWDVSNIESMESMFNGASSFNQSLGDWDIGNVTAMANMLDGSGLSESNYDATLIGWADDNGGTQTIPSNLSFGAAGITYSCVGLAARSSLESTYSWTIDDGGGGTGATLVLDASSLPDIEEVCQVTLADLTSPTATDNCESETVTGTVDESQFPLTESTILTWTFVGALGNSTTQDQNVVIQDNVAPVADVASLSELTDECAVSAPASPTATDNCDGAITGVADVTFPLTESTTITWTYTDDSGNTTTQEQGVVIADVTAPVVDVASLTELTDECSISVPASPTATDNCDGAITGVPDVTFPLTASTTITWTYTDEAGNATTQEQDVVIEDNTAPVADVTSLSDLSGECSVSAPDSPTATDNCDGAITGVADVTFPLTESTTITWTYTDEAGNATTQEQGVIVTCDPPLSVSKDSELRLFPNPASEILEIQSSRNEAVQILDLSGTVVMNASTNTRLDISQLRSGVYLISVRGGHYRFIKR